ncbi:TPM domain-containing protein [Zymomonas mobilis]|uniref:TPM domain-containing protein n=1 Tax=Zymomonas mobilis TaxID=542 RepID=UPI0039E885B2
MMKPVAMLSPRKNLSSGYRLFGLLLLFVFLVFAKNASAFAQNFPELGDQYVVDDAQILTPADKTQLNSDLAMIEAKSGHQMVVVTLSDLQGYDIRDYGYRLGRYWKIGHAKINDGLIFLVYTNHNQDHGRKVSVEVGYGLEGQIPDALAFTLLHQKVTPIMKKDPRKGIKTAVQIFGDLLTDPNDELRNKSLAAEQTYQSKRATDPLPSDVKPLPPIHPLFWIILFCGGGLVIIAMISEGQYRSQKKPQTLSSNHGVLPPRTRLQIFFATLWSVIKTIFSAIYAVLKFFLAVLSIFSILSMLFNRRGGGGGGSSSGGGFWGGGNDDSGGSDDSFGGGDGGSFGGGGASDDY